jgi:16S rRNA (cytosine967-C5)-methyltransferase
MENRGEIYALDLSTDKLHLIEQICQRLGIRIVKVLRADVAGSLPLSKGLVFDRVLADVPCSGFGTLRKNPDLKWRRAEKDIKRLSELQFSILSNLSTYVEKRGVLIYSTCTVFHEENEDVVEQFLEGHPGFQLDQIAKVLPEKGHQFIHNRYFKTFPPQNGMDGFFVARLKKES